MSDSSAVFTAAAATATDSVAATGAVAAVAPGETLTNRLPSESRASTESKASDASTPVVAFDPKFGAWGPNPLPAWFESHTGRVVHKWVHYFDIYHRHFGATRAAATPDRKAVIYEIGVQNGGSLDMWLDYFGRDRCEVYGFDVDPRCAALGGAHAPNVHIAIGDQGDAGFWETQARTLPRPDIVLDDGGHTMRQQTVTMHALFAHLKPGGVYMCEDTHTSYWAPYGGGLRRVGSYIETTKALADSLHSFHASAEIAPDYYSVWCDATHTYDSVIVLDKRLTEKTKPYAEERGNIRI